MTTDKVKVKAFADDGKCKNSIKVLIDGDGTYSAEANKNINRFHAGALYEFTLYHAIERIAQLESQLSSQVVTDSSKVLDAALAENERLKAKINELEFGIYDQGGMFNEK